MQTVEIVLAVVGIAAGVWATLKQDVQIAGLGVVLIGAALLLLLAKF